MPLSRPTSSERFHFLPSHSRLTRCLFFRPANSILAVADALSIFPADVWDIALAYRFRCCSPSPESIRSPPFNITRSRARHFCSDPPAPRPYVSFEPRIEKHRRINLFRSTVRAAAGSRELSSEHGDSGKANDESEIDSCPIPLSACPDIIYIYIYVLWKQ